MERPISARGSLEEKIGNQRERPLEVVCLEELEGTYLSVEVSLRTLRTSSPTMAGQEGGPV